MAAPITDLERRERKRAYERNRRRGILSPRVLVPIEVRLLAKTDRLYGDEPPNGRIELGICWPWLGARNADGYGIIRGEFEADGSQPLLLAHRVALSLALGRPLGDGMNALHRCDYPPCVRPRHLREGTQQENVDEMMERYYQRPPIKRARVG
jgi:HNH endonuclease